MCIWWIQLRLANRWLHCRLTSACAELCGRAMRWVLFLGVDAGALFKKRNQRRVMPLCIVISLATMRSSDRRRPRMTN